MTPIADRIRQRRIELGMTQRELARRVYVYYLEIELLENGIGRPTGDYLRRLAEVLDVTEGWIIHG